MANCCGQIREDFHWRNYEMKYTKEDIIILDEKSLRAYQTELLKIAKDVVDFFDGNKIEYSLSGGSILGAIRHKGFIPWDDDIDLNVPRGSYNKMLHIFERQLGERYYIQTPQKCPDMGLMVTQIRKKGTIARRKYDWNIRECGISIDIYIIENVFDNRLKRFFQRTFSMVFSFVISAIRYYNNKDLPRELIQWERRQINYSVCKQVVGKVLRIISLKKWISWCDYWNSICHDEQSKFVAIPTGRKHFSGETYERSKITMFKKMPFESMEFNVPVWAEGFLEKFYGDYMKLPPVEEREKHLFLELKF